MDITPRSDAPAEDGDFLARAIDLADRGRGRTSPNPTVGCVLVRDGRVVGEGWHGAAGADHAEVVALADAGSDARGATAYVSLEPCAHRGRTGPCVRALIEAGVTEVVFAASDPNPTATGGAEQLRAAGVAVRRGDGAGRVREQNEVFFHVHETGRAHVTLKLAQTLDGRAAARDGSSRWITSPDARTAVHALRAEVDGVVVGSGTVLADDPELTVRHVEPVGGQPLPVVLDARGRTPADSRLVARGALIVTTEHAEGRWRDEVEAAGAEIVVGDPAAGHDGGVALEPALRELAARGAHGVLVEGGPTLAGGLLAAGLVDRLILHVAPAIIGGGGLPAVAGPGAATIDDRSRWRIAHVGRLGPDLEVVARPAAAA